MVETQASEESREVGMIASHINTESQLPSTPTTTNADGSYSETNRHEYLPVRSGTTEDEDVNEAIPLHGNLDDEDIAVVPTARSLLPAATASRFHVFRDQSSIRAPSKVLEATLHNGSATQVAADVKPTVLRDDATSLGLIPKDLNKVKDNFPNLKLSACGNSPRAENPNLHTSNLPAESCRQLQSPNKSPSFESMMPPRLPSLLSDTPVRPKMHSQQPSMLLVPSSISIEESPPYTDTVGSSLQSSFAGKPSGLSPILPDWMLQLGFGFVNDTIDQESFGENTEEQNKNVHRNKLLDEGIESSHPNSQPQPLPTSGAQPKTANEEASSDNKEANTGLLKSQNLKATSSHEDSIVAQNLSVQYSLGTKSTVSKSTETPGSGWRSSSAQPWEAHISEGHFFLGTFTDTTASEMHSTFYKEADDSLSGYIHGREDENKADAQDHAGEDKVAFDKTQRSPQTRDLNIAVLGSKSSISFDGTDDPESRYPSLPQLLSSQSRSAPPLVSSMTTVKPIAKDVPSERDESQFSTSKHDLIENIGAYHETPSALLRNSEPPFHSFPLNAGEYRKDSFEDDRTGGAISASELTARQSQNHEDEDSSNSTSFLWQNMPLSTSFCVPQQDPKLPLTPNLSQDSYQEQLLQANFNSAQDKSLPTPSATQSATHEPLREGRTQSFVTETDSGRAQWQEHLVGTGEDTPPRDPAKLASLYLSPWYDLTPKKVEDEKHVGKAGRSVVFVQQDSDSQKSSCVEDESGNSEKVNTLESANDRETSPVSPAPVADIVQQKNMDSDFSFNLSQITRARGLLTDFSYYSPLPGLFSNLRIPSNSHCYNDGYVDVIAVVTKPTTKPLRADRGQRDYHTTLSITDPAFYPRNMRVQVFRPWREALPAADKGDIVLLRGFEVFSSTGNVGVGLKSVESSAWCVWRFLADAEVATATGDSSVDDKAWAWLRRERNDLIDWNQREEIRGPPVEFGEQERVFVKDLKTWWAKTATG
ncbi:hypothetical protein, variant [Verruconis gallopava]|nr:hypothetical protein, variant [Verruconis gallopava]KIW01625.1 hypothetical protein, variant [Verruconis gallopava]